MLAPPSLLTSKTMIFTGFCKNNCFQCNEVPSSPGVPRRNNIVVPIQLKKQMVRLKLFMAPIAMLELHTWGSLCDKATYLLDFFLKTFA